MNGYKLDINSGDKFSRLTVIKEVEKRGKNRRFLCKCDCGVEKEVFLSEFAYGGTKSCGCYRKEKNRKSNTTHGDCKEKLYKVWASMKQRCINPNSREFKHYGKRGITICKEWLDYEPFKEWALMNGYKEGLSIERIDVNGNYEPSNCTWIPRIEQPKNTRRTIYIKYNGKDQTISEWADELGMNYETLRMRLSRGWSVERAITEPLNVSGERYGT